MLAKSVISERGKAEAGIGEDAWLNKGRRKKTKQTVSRDKIAKISMNQISWEQAWQAGRSALLNERRSETAFASRSRVFRPSWIIRRRAYSWTRGLGNVETVVRVLIKSNETNLRPIMRP